MSYKNQVSRLDIKRTPEQFIQAKLSSLERQGDIFLSTVLEDLPYGLICGSYSLCGFCQGLLDTSCVVNQVWRRGVWGAVFAKELEKLNLQEIGKSTRKAQHCTRKLCAYTWQAGIRNGNHRKQRVSLGVRAFKYLIPSFCLQVKTPTQTWLETSGLEEKCRGEPWLTFCVQLELKKLASPLHQQAQTTTTQEGPALSSKEKVLAITDILA